MYILSSHHHNSPRLTRTPTKLHHSQWGLRGCKEKSVYTDKQNSTASVIFKSPVRTPNQTALFSTVECGLCIHTAILWTGHTAWHGFDILLRIYIFDLEYSESSLFICTWIKLPYLIKINMCLLTIGIITPRRRVVRFQFLQAPYAKSVQTRQHSRFNKHSLAQRTLVFALVEGNAVNALCSGGLRFALLRCMGRRVWSVMANFLFHRSSLGRSYFLALTSPGEAAEDVWDTIYFHSHLE